MTDQPTPAPLTEQQLADIQARVDAATAGPWHFTDADSIVAPLTADSIADVWEPTSASRNGEFIEAAREDVRALLAEVRRLTAQRQFLLGQLAARDAESGRGDEAVRAFLAGSPAEEPSAVEDPLAPWLAQRFDPRGAPWDGMSDDDRSHWEHQARTVRRAVTRGGFEAAEGAQQTATLLVDRTSSACAACDQPTLPSALSHTDVSGYDPKPGGGCGARFTAIRSVNRSVTEDDLRSMRPDLPTAP